MRECSNARHRLKALLLRNGKPYAESEGAMQAAPSRWLGPLPCTSCPQDFPKSQITVVLPLAPGDAGDIALRAMSEELSRHVDGYVKEFRQCASS